MIKWKDWFKILLVFVTPIFFDQILKLLTREFHNGAVIIGWLGFFANFSESDTYSSFYAPIKEIKGLIFIIFGICLFQLNILINFLFALSYIVRYSISLILGGLMCFLLDNIFHDQIINNLAITFNSQQFFSFNLAILFICIGLILLSLILMIKPQELLNPINVRKTLLTGHAGQKQLIIFLLSFFTIIYYAISFLIGVFNMTALPVLDSKTLQVSMVQYFFLFVVAVYICITPLFYAMIVRLSNRIYGPVYGFQNYMIDLFEKKYEITTPFQTRKKDYLKELETIAEYIRTRILRKL